MTKSLPSTGRFTLRTLCLAVTSCAIVLGLLSWPAIRPLCLPLAIAVPLYWCGILCMSLSSRQSLDQHPLVLLGCVLLSMAVLLGVCGPLLVLVLWLLAEVQR